MARRQAPPPKPPVLLTSRRQHIDEQVARDFLSNAETVTTTTNELVEWAADISRALQALKTALRGRSKEEMAAEQAEEFERRHTRWKQYVSVHPSAFNSPEPQPPAEAEAVPPLPFDSVVRDELLERIETIQENLHEVNEAVEGLSEEVDRFKDEIEELQA